VSCTAVREALPEFALGVAGGDETASIELHVETCAACRREAIDLQRAAASLGFALAPLSPDPALEQRVVDAVRRRVRPAKVSAHGGRRAATLLLAAAIVVAGIGVGTVFAGHQAQQRLEADRQAFEQTQTLERFGLVASQLDPATKIFTGTLAAPSGPGTGAGLTLVSPAVQDQLVVIVNDVQARSLPLSVSISDENRHIFEVGEITHLDTSGSATFASIVGASLRDFTEVVVRDAKGRVALRGTLAAETTVASPAP
jgi:predicted anti-sigma-YlaC factor YlaD